MKKMESNNWVFKLRIRFLQNTSRRLIIKKWRIHHISRRILSQSSLNRKFSSSVPWKTLTLSLCFNRQLEETETSLGKISRFLKLRCIIIWVIDRCSLLESPQGKVFYLNLPGKMLSLTLKGHRCCQPEIKIEFRLKTNHPGYKWETCTNKFLTLELTCKEIHLESKTRYKSAHKTFFTILILKSSLSDLQFMYLQTKHRANSWIETSKFKRIWMS